MSCRPSHSPDPNDPPATAEGSCPAARHIAQAVDRLRSTGFEVVVGVVGSREPGLRGPALDAADVTLHPQDLISVVDGEILLAVADPDLEHGAQRFDRFVDALAQRLPVLVGYADSRRHEAGAVLVQRACDGRRRHR